MWSAPHRQEPIEKIRKAQWTAENTARTQAVVDELVAHRKAFAHLFGSNSYLLSAIDAMLHRVSQLDAAVKVERR